MNRTINTRNLIPINPRKSAVGKMKTIVQVALIMTASLVIIVTSNLHGDLCTSNLGCSQDNLQCVDGRCDCLPNTSLNSRRTCSRNYGGPCTHVLDCNIDLFLKCNNTIGECDCQQPEQQTFDENRNRCVSLVGFTCSHDDTMPFALYCVEGAYCDMPIINGSMYHSCECGDEWDETPDSRCSRRPTGPPNTSRPN